MNGRREVYFPRVGYLEPFCWEATDYLDEPDCAGRCTDKRPPALKFCSIRRSSL